MNFDIHIDEMKRKTFGTLLFINRIKDNLDRDTRIIVVQSLVLSIINYCSVIWGSANATQISRVQKMQNFAAKVAQGKSRKFDHVTPVLKELNWLNISKKITYDTLLTMFKFMHQIYPSYLQHFPTVNEVVNSNTRQHDMLYVPKCRTNMGSNSLVIKGPKLWNSLPSQIKSINNIKTFKTKIKDILLSRSSN